MEQSGKKFTYKKKDPQITKVAHPFDYFIVLDFEAVWNIENGKKNPEEIIEFPSVLVERSTLKNVSEFQMYVKPKINIPLNDYCIQITGIQQEWVDKGSYLKEVLEAYHKWMLSNNLIDENSNPKTNFTFVTCGGWDLGKMLPLQCNREKIECPPYFKRWINIKDPFCSFYKEKKMGMAGMLKRLKLELSGRHHSGIDDCRNIAKILKKMIEDGYTFS